MPQYGVFERTETNAPVVSNAVYNLTIGLVLGWGFLLNWLIVKYVDPEWLSSVNIWVFILAYFASCFLGAYLFNRSKNPIISFVGYNLVVVPFGLVLNLIVSSYDPNLVLQAITVTALVTVIMMILGTLFPRFFQAILPVLFIALLAMIVVQLLEIFVFHNDPGWIDWVVAVIFCGYIGFDWGRANQIPKTLDNAVDSAAALYMDIINLFVRILSIMGRRRR